MNAAKSAEQVTVAPGWYMDSHDQIMYKTDLGSWYYWEKTTRQMFLLSVGHIDQSLEEWFSSRPNEHLYPLRVDRDNPVF